MTVFLDRWVEFDAGHRVPDHASKCRHPHGHRYRLEVYVTGVVKHDRGDAEDGMVCDFGILGGILDQIAIRYDHTFLVAEHDKTMRDFLAQEAFRHVVIGGPPTAEVLVERMAVEVADLLPDGITLSCAKLWETPKCQATFSF